MNEQDLNIRAAKALGAKCIDSENRDLAFYFPPNIKFPSGGRIQQVGWLKFTTSYDWAMLGVKACHKGKFGLELIVIMADITPQFYNPYFLGEFFTATPQQITQAWVEVLESE